MSRPTASISRAAIVPLFVLMSAAASGCGADAPAAERGELRTTTETIDGVVHILNEGVPPQLRLQEVLRLGVLMDGGPEEFGRIRSLTADAEGNVYIADNIGHEIRVFDPQGSYLRTIGRPGRGPGEFGSLYSLAWLDGRLAVMDPSNVRIGLIEPEGDWVGQIDYYPFTGPPTITRLHPLGEEGFYGRVLGDPGTRPYARFTSEGPADTILRPALPEDAPPIGVLCQRPDGVLQSIVLPDAPGVVFAFPPPGGEVAVSWTDRMRIAVLDGDGDTLRIVSHERSPMPYTDAAWQEDSRPYREMMRDFPGTRCEPRDLRRPPHRAALHHIMFSPSGEMWVEATAEDGLTWDVFDAEGRLVGRAPAPDRKADVPPYTRDDLLYQVETDEFDVQYVAAYRLVHGS